MSEDESTDPHSQSEAMSENVADSERRIGEDRASSESLSRDALRVELERYRERTKQLQKTYARTKTTEYRRAALGLGVLGAVAVAGAAVIPHLRTLLLTLGAIGLFGAVLTYYLTPERFITAEVGTGIYRAQSDDRAALVEALDLSDHRVYVPVGDADPRVRLFVPQFRDYDVPEADDLPRPIVVPTDDAGRGVTFTPTGRGLYESFTDAMSGDPTGGPTEVAAQLREALVEQFELIDQAVVDVDRDQTSLTVAISGSRFGPPDQFDHPVVSVFAVAFARMTRRPVSVEITATERDQAEYLLTYRWNNVPRDRDGG